MPLGVGQEKLVVEPSSMSQSLQERLGRGRGVPMNRVRVHTCSLVDRMIHKDEVHAVSVLMVEGDLLEAALA